MTGTRFESRSSEWAGDLTVWLRAHAEDNGEQMERLRKQLRRARETDLTPRQRQILTLYYEQGMNMAQIARKIGRDRSTVSRTMKRAREKLRRCLCYAL